LKIENNLSFSSDGAETLGLECAVILSQYNSGKLDDISSLHGLLESIKKNLSFLNKETIENSVNTLINYGLIKFEKI
jgi:hypothetical protein